MPSLSGLGLGGAGCRLFLTQHRYEPLFLCGIHRWRKRSTWVLRRAKNALLRMTTSCLGTAEDPGLALVSFVPVKAPPTASAASGEELEFFDPLLGIVRATPAVAE